MTPDIQPPKLFERFFRWYCHPELREELAGDLEESFFKNIELEYRRFFVGKKSLFGHSQLSQSQKKHFILFSHQYPHPVYQFDLLFPHYHRLGSVGTLCLCRNNFPDRHCRHHLTGCPGWFRRWTHRIRAVICYDWHESRSQYF